MMGDAWKEYDFLNMILSIMWQELHMLMLAMYLMKQKKILSGEHGSYDRSSPKSKRGKRKRNYLYVIYDRIWRVCSLWEKKIIDENTIPTPANFYGDSKLQADVAIRELADDNFKVIVLRPPMIYGKGSKGNYPVLAKLAKSSLYFRMWIMRDPCCILRTYASFYAR